MTVRSALYKVMDMNGTASNVRFPTLGGIPSLWGLVLAVFLSASASAQDAGGLEIAKVKGELKMVAGYQLKLATDDKKEVLAVINPQKTNFTYVGTAEPQFLVPGLMVRFSGAFDAAGRPSGPIKEIEIFTPIQKRRMTAEFMQSQTAGVYPIQDGGAKPAEANSKKDGAALTQQLASKQPAAKNKPGTKGKADEKSTLAPAPAGSQNFRVVGKIAAAQGDTLRIAAGNLPIMVQLDPEVVITVASGDTTFCMEGDKVEVTGLRNASQKDVVEAETVIVTGAKPLGTAEQEKSNRKPRSRRDRGSGLENKPDAKGDPKGVAKAKPGEKPNQRKN